MVEYINNERTKRNVDLLINWVATENNKADKPSREITNELNIDDEHPVFSAGNPYTATERKVSATEYVKYWGK